jgi:hypothetical protein
VRIDGRPDWKVGASVVRDAHDFVASSQPRRRIRDSARARFLKRTRKFVIEP